MTIASIKTARRVFEVLEHFREVRQPQRLRDVVARFDYPTSSTAALLKCMTELGYLVFDRAGLAYLPSLKVAQLGAWIAEARYDHAAANARLARIQAITGETILLAVQQHAEAVYVEVLPSRLPLQYVVAPGTRRSMTGSGCGWALLAMQPDDAGLSLLQGTEIRDRQALLARLAAVRRDGYAFSRHTVTPGIGVIAVPVASEIFGQAMAIAVGGPVERLDNNRDANVAALLAG